MEPHYNYADYQRMVEEKGQALYGRRYSIHTVDQPCIQRMIAYFLQDQARAKEERIFLGKGLMLSGPVGCGKTALMQIFTAMSGGAFVPRIVSTRQVAMEYGRLGHEVIRKYSDLAFDKETHLPVVYCFDGLGAESDMQYYGQTCNVMGEILLSRGDLARPHNMLTHVITSLDAASLEKRYGKQVRSRMREMFNLVAFSANSADKRV
ncbi:hypothetical protein [Chitinophaga caseinilytica]|uniref:ATPase n=1 Tax=Chitinophaga caseinilytica TaxID=2267521 RepID=A0ABZ2Z2X1_9BACT